MTVSLGDEATLDITHCQFVFLTSKETCPKKPGI